MADLFGRLLDLNEASALRDKLLSLRGSGISIDASGVERIGALCAQVLMSAEKT
ncbi:STAS domain-containing protein, partial [Rhizobium ruizarguesonis]